MTEPPVVNFASAKMHRSKRNPNDHVLAEFAMAKCEQAFIRRDWDQFGYWFDIYRTVRNRSQEGGNGAIPVAASETDNTIPERPEALTHKRLSGAGAARRMAKVGLALLALMVTVPAPAQTPSYSLSSKGRLLSSTTLSEGPVIPPDIRLIAGRLWSDEVGGTVTANGFFYQISGSTEVSIDGKPANVSAGDAIFVPNGAQVHLKATGPEPSAYFRFILAPASYVELPDLAAINEHEIYRSSTPIGGLGEGQYVLTLTKVTLPFQSPADMPHHRSGAALHVVLSGFGAETANGTTVIKSPGSISYEPADLVYQWSNPGNVPLTYLVFNLNREAESAIVATAPPNDPMR